MALTNRRGKKSFRRRQGIWRRWNLFLSDDVIRAGKERRRREAEEMDPVLLKAVEAIEELNFHNRKKAREKILEGVKDMPGRVRDESIRNNLHVLR